MTADGGTAGHAGDGVGWSAPRTSQPGCVPEPDHADRLPRVPVTGAPTLLWVGAHGGAGTTTLAALLPGSRALSGAWPTADLPTADQPTADLPVVLVARTSAGSLEAARRAVVQWAAGLVPGVELLGLVLVADRPGRLPRELCRLRQLVAGGAPRTWDLPWVEEWRRGAPPDPATAPGAHRRLVAELSGLTGRHRAPDRRAPIPPPSGPVPPRAPAVPVHAPTGRTS